MSSGVNSNSNNEISINDLQKRLVNIEEKFFENEGTKSVFEEYNRTKASNNKPEYLNRSELQQFIDDIKKYDEQGNNNGILDFDEAEMFVKDFNENHTECQIKTEDIFGFIKNLYKIHDYYNNGENSQLMTENITVGDALSEKNIKLHVNVDGQIKVVSVNIKLYTTNDKNVLHQYAFEVIDGEEYADKVAEEFGYSGKDSFGLFMSKSLGKPNSETYEINFSPQYKRSLSGDGTKGTENIPDGQFIIGEANGEDADIIIVPQGFDRDPRDIQAQYNNPEVQEIMQEFFDYISDIIDGAEQTFKEYLDSYGFTAKAADLVSHIWNNGSALDSGNTKEQVRALIDRAKEFVKKVPDADSSLEGVLTHKDYGAFFKEFTGVDFNPTLVRNFINTRKDYLEKETAIHVYKMASHLEETVNQYELSREINTSVKKVNVNNISNDEVKSMVEDEIDRTDSHYKKQNDELFNAFNFFIGISGEKWNLMLKDLEDRNIDPIEFIKSFAKNIKNNVTQETMIKLGIDNPDDIEQYEERLNKHYNETKSYAIGDSDMVDKIDKYHTSQIIGGAVVSGIIQLALYATGLSAVSLINSSAKLLKTGKTLSEVANIAGRIGAMTGEISSGVASGSSYSASYFMIDVADRLSNDIDNSEDLFNKESMSEIILNSGIEFAAGYLFDGILKTKYFGKFEKKALDLEKSLTNPTKISEIAKNPELVESIGLSAVTRGGVKFSEEKILQIIGVRGLAACVGGAKDGTKEMFKETLALKYNIKDITAATIVGAVSNALFIRFKNADFAKKDHKIIGKFLEKSPKKSIKNDLKYSEIVLSKQEHRYLSNFLNDIKTAIKTELRQNLNASGNREALDFINSNPDEAVELIIDYYALQLFESAKNN